MSTKRKREPEDVLVLVVCNFPSPMQYPVLPQNLPVYIAEYLCDLISKLLLKPFIVHIS